MKNPLYPSKLVNDANQNLQNFNKCFIITLEKDIVVEAFDKDITNNDYYDKIVENYSIKSVPMWMIKSISNFKNRFIIFEQDEDSLLLFKFKLTNLNNDEEFYSINNAVIFLPNHNWFWFSELIEPFIRDGIKDMHNFFMKDLTIPFEDKLNSHDLQGIINKIMSSRDVNYWKDFEKCQLNITTPFLKRDIDFNDAKEINDSTKKIMAQKCNDYLSDIIKKKKYVDASSGIKTHKYNLYYIDEYNNIDVDKFIVKTIIHEPKNSSFNKRIFLENILNSALISKKYCGNILKNPIILEYIHANFSTFKKSFAYAWLMMYLEEGILKSMIKEDDRCVFTLEQARALPALNNIDSRNVYIPLMVEKSYINIFGGYQSSNNQSIQLSTMNVFKERLRKFITIYDIDIFEGLDWTNLGITGSVIAATCRKIDPLELDGGYDTYKFFDTYYKDSDIDVMCDCPDYKSYVDRVYNLLDTIKSNIKKFKDEPDVLNYEITKTAALHLNIKYIKDKLDNKINDDIAYNIYKQIKESEDKLDEKYHMINQIVPVENFKYYVYQNEDVSEAKYNPNYSENIKFHVSSPYMSRKLEIFKIKYNFLSTVSRFHLPCVRGYYNGKNVYLIPSAISALLTNKSIDYKYFAGAKSPFEILLKYVFRGYTLFLNKKEMIKLVEYIKNNEKWKNLYKLDDNFRVNTFQSYYTNPFVLLDNPNIKYIDYRKYVETNPVSYIISSFGYVIPYNQN